MLLHVVLVNDDLALQKKLKRLLGSPDTLVEIVRSQRRFISKLSRRICDLAIVSPKLVGPDAVGQIQKLKEMPMPPSIIMLTDREDEQETALYTAAGCEAVLHVNLPDKKLGEAIEAVLERRRKIAQIAVPTLLKTVDAQIGDFAATSPAMAKFISTLPRIAKSDSSVLVLGETGVGKERLARVLHSESPRKEGPFVPVHCAALPETLLESELFGHEQGAFTGATKARRGCFELAHGGTIFLDEIGEMALHLQSKLLRVLESREIKRVGGEASIVVDVRILAATNRDLDQEVNSKQFRRDLFYRLNVVSLTIPPLRDRIQDVPELVNSYMEHLSAKIGCTVSGIAQEALDALCTYDWPGNVRELINVIERAMLLCEDDVIMMDDLPVTITGEVPTLLSAGQPSDQPLFGAFLNKPLKEARNELVSQFEREYFTSLLREKRGRLGEAAKAAGIDVRTLFSKMKYYGFNKEDYKTVIDSSSAL
jgi:two-component system, NtrC family, response regulator AtoC